MSFYINTKENFMGGSGFPFSPPGSGEGKGPVPEAGSPASYPPPLGPTYTKGGPPFSAPAPPDAKPSPIPLPKGSQQTQFPGIVGPPPGVHNSKTKTTNSLDYNHHTSDQSKYLKNKNWNYRYRNEQRSKVIWPFIPFGYQGWYGNNDYYNYPSTVFNQTYNYYGDNNLDDRFIEEELYDEAFHPDLERKLYVTKSNFVKELK